MVSSFAKLKLAVLAVAVLIAGLAPGDRDFAAALRRAEDRRAALEVRAATEAYWDAARLDPASPRPWLRLGDMLLARRRFAEAGLAFDEAEVRDGGAEALIGAGDSLAGQGDWAAAMRAWLQAAALAPGDPRAHLALARGSVAQGQFEAAGEHLGRVLQLAPPADVAAAAHRWLGWLLAGSSPTAAAGHLRLAADDDMLAVLDAVAAEPDPARQAVLLGAAFLQRGELTLARRHLQAALALDAGNAEAHAYLGHVLDGLGETVAAGAALDRARSLDPDLVIVTYFLGRHERLVGNPDRAQEAVWAGLQRDPENAALRVEMAEAFLDRHDYAAAEEWYRGAVEVAPAGQQVSFYLVLLHFYVDHVYRVAGAGVQAAEEANALAPDDARVQDLLGWTDHLAGRHAEAERALVRALALDPGQASAHYHLGSLYVTTGRPELAGPHLRRAADLDLGSYYRGRAEAMLRDLP